jgi:2-phosphosulfolactate phosphatase
VVVVIDVVRAFTTAAAAFAAGATTVVCAADEHRARARAREEAGILVGERAGLRPPNFDHGNSPIEVSDGDVAGRTVVLATENGTPALVRAAAAGPVAAMAAVNIDATASWIREHRPQASVAVMWTGDHGEDRACAEQLGSILTGRAIDAARTRSLIMAAIQTHLTEWRRWHGAPACRRFYMDALWCANVDSLSIAMLGDLNKGSVVLRAWHAGEPPPLV